MTALLALLSGRVGGFITALAAAAMLGSIAYGYGHHRGHAQGYAEADALRTADRLAWMGAVLTRNAETRATEAHIAELQEGITHETTAHAAQRASDAAGARAAADSLQHRVDALVAASRGGRLPADPAAAAECKATSDALVLLAELHQRVTNRSVQLAGEATERGVAGLECQQLYDAVRAGTNEHLQKRGLAPDDGMPMDMGGMQH